MKYVIAELDKKHLAGTYVQSISDVTDYIQLLINIKNHLSDGGIHLSLDTIDTINKILTKDGIVFWTNKTTEIDYCAIDIDYSFHLYNTTGLRIFNQLKPFLRDNRINEILSVPL